MAAQLGAGTDRRLASLAGGGSAPKTLPGLMSMSGSPEGEVHSLRSTSGTVLEVLALAVAFWVAVALMQDDRITLMHTLALWMGVAVSVAPVVRIAARRQGSLRVNLVVTSLLAVAMLGSFTIGGLAMGIPAILLIVGGVFHHLGIEGEARAQRVGFTGVLVVGVCLVAVGAVSMGPSVILAPVGLLLVIMGVLARRSVRAPKDGQRVAG